MQQFSPEKQSDNIMSDEAIMRRGLDMPEGVGGVDTRFDVSTYDFTSFVGLSYRLQEEEARL